MTQQMPTQFFKPENDYSVCKGGTKKIKTVNPW